MEDRRIVLYFVCTSNSCRSQMAEGWARHLGGDRVEVYSGGLEPRGVHPLAVEIMQEIGIDISRQTSDSIDPALLARADYVITLCGDAEERCPATPAAVTRLHWGLPDPAKATGSPEEVRAVFRQIRDEIGERIKKLLAELYRH